MRITIQHSDLRLFLHALDTYAKRCAMVATTMPETPENGPLRVILDEWAEDATSFHKCFQDYEASISAAIARKTLRPAPDLVLIVDVDARVAPDVGVGEPR